MILKLPSVGERVVVQGWIEFEDEFRLAFTDVVVRRLRRNGVQPRLGESAKALVFIAPGFKLRFFGSVDCKPGGGL